MDSKTVDKRGSRLWSALAASLCALAVAPASSSAATIDFESIAPGATVNSQYSAQGVTFNGSRVFEYGAGFAHSGTKTIENCRGSGFEFCGQPPIRAEFTTGQTTVGAWVGVSPSAPTPPGPRAIRLTAFDSGGNPVGTADVTLPPNSPVTNHLTVTAPGATIRAFEVKPNDSADSWDILVDDVEFSTAGPPPPCNASGPPIINLTSPVQGSVFQNNQILLQGTVDNRGAPITDATVVSDGSTLRTAQGFPTPIGANGGSFAINMNGLLQEGNQKVFATATNCAGTGVSVNPAVAFSPLPAGTGFHQLSQIEVTQTVQSPFNPVPLIAGGPNGTKRTIARVYLSAEGGASQITGVSGRLTATRLDGSRPGGPLTIDSLNTITVPAGQTLEGARSSLDNSLNFELPAEWLTEGRLHLQLEQLKIEGTQSTYPCDECDNPLFGSSTGATVTFHRVPPLRIWLVGVPFTPAVGNGPISPRQKDFDFLASWLRRAYPASDVQITQAALPVSFDQPGFVDEDDDGVDENRDGFLCDDVQSRLSEWAPTMPAQPAQTRYYGVVADTGGLFMRGCASIGGRFGSGPAGSGSFGWDNDGAYTDWYGGHELGHSFNRKHPDGGCEDSDDDGSFPFIGGAIGDFVFDNQGIDVGDATLSPAQPLALYDWRTGWQDVMTYCEEQWLSSYTYNGILKNLCGKDKPNCPDNATLSKLGRAAKRGGPRLSIQGTLNLANQHVSLDPMSALGGLTLTERPKKSDYAIVERDARGKSVASYPFEPKEISDLPAGQRLASIDEVVPFSPQTKRIEISHGKQLLASKRVSAHAPVVNLRSLKAKKLTKPVMLRWSSRDADGDKLLSTLQYAADAKHYVTIAAGLKRQKLKVDPADLPGGKKARFRVVVTDGVLTGIDKSKPLKVAAKPPTISIATPVDGAQLTEGQSVQLVASVQDDQDARLGDEVAWTSDVQGELGGGAMLTTQLQPGTHRITASVTNSGRKTATATITVEVAAIPETVDAQLIP